MNNIWSGSGWIEAEDKNDSTFEMTIESDNKIWIRCENFPATVSVNLTEEQWNTIVEFVTKEREKNVKA